MGKLTKKAKALQGKVETTKLYPLADALSLVKDCATAKFDESIDVAVQLGIDPKNLMRHNPNLVVCLITGYGLPDRAPGLDVDGDFADWGIPAGILTRYLAGRLLVFSFLTPLFGVWFGMMLMRDQPSLHFFLAAALVVGGIVLVNLPARK